MNKNYSINRIIKNRIGIGAISMWFFSIILFIITILFVKDFELKIYMFIVVSFLYLFIPIYSMICFIKIIAFFKNGVEAKAVVTGTLYKAIGRQPPFEATGEELDQTGDVFAYKNKWGRREYMKKGIIYEYTIDGEAYKSSSAFIITGDTMFLKEGSIVTIFANPKNKNDTIIKDIYAKLT